MAKIRYVLVGFGGIAENRVAKEGYACDKKRFKPLKNAVLVGAMDLNPARQKAAEALGLCEAISNSLYIVGFGIPMLVAHDTSAYEQEKREAQNASVA